MNVYALGHAPFARRELVSVRAQRLLGARVVARLCGEHVGGDAQPAARRMAVTGR